MNTHKAGAGARADAIDESQRIKRWAPRAKTGCVTCRRRRVKCDEAKPICGQCVTTRRYCAGPFYQDSAPTLPSSQDWPAALARRAMTAPKSVRATNHRGWEIVPEGWDVVEAYEYLGTQCLPIMMSLNLMAPGPAGPTTLAAIPGSVNSESFISRVIADRIVFVSCHRRIALQPSTSYGTTHLWSRFYELTNRHLHKINHDITQTTGDTLDYLLKRRVFERICDLTEAEHVLCLPGWRAHMNGYFALLKMFGIPKNIPSSNPCFMETLRSMTVYATVGNTVSSMEHQLVSIYDFDDAEIANIFARSEYPPFPCPTKLFAEIVAINRLRLMAASCKIGAIMPAVNAIFMRIHAFDPETWRISENFPIPDIPEVPLMARIFQLSVSLYGLLSLRLEMTDANAAPGWADKATTLSELLTLMRKAAVQPKCLNVMVWAAAVVGVALADGGPAESRQFITDCLVAVDSGILGYGIAAVTVGRLQKFWLSGKTSWDDCWNEFYLLF